MIRLPKSTYNWALKHLLKEGDTDLFPIPFEINAIKYNWDTILPLLAKLDLTNYIWDGGRRFVVPKEKTTFRSATQLHPLDSLILAALIKQHGNKIEKARIPKEDNCVFSYRFDPQPDGRFYGQTSNWHEFWKTSLDKANNKNIFWVVIADITDYYNQIYHHVIGNQLKEAGLPDSIASLIENKFLSKLTQGVSRGIPIGPHAVHLLSECAFIPIDKSFLSHGYNYCRYVDDVHFFCKTEDEAQIALYDFAEIIDKQQRLTPQKQKLRILSKDEFITLANSMLIDRPLNKYEERLIKMIKKYSDDNPYIHVNLTDLSIDDLQMIDENSLTKLFELYLQSSPINYVRLGWLLRRLSQIGAPGGINFVLSHINLFTPILGETSRYLMSASINFHGDFEKSGQLILKAIENPVIMRSEYLQITLVYLFSKVPQLNHINELIKKYEHSQQSIKREIVIAAGVARQGHFIKERKDEFYTSDQWLKRAILYSSSVLPGDEAEHWIKKIKENMSGLDKFVTRYSFKKKDLKLGEISLQ